MRKNWKFFVLILALGFMASGLQAIDISGNARFCFANRDSNIVLKNDGTNSARLYLNVPRGDDRNLGWVDGSVIRDTDEEGAYNLANYTDDSGLVTYETAPYYFVGMNLDYIEATQDITINNIRYIKDGFSIYADATLALNTPLRLSGEMEFETNETSTLALGGDLVLASDASFVTGGQISGNGHAILLSDNFALPETTPYHDTNILKFTSDTTIDGGGNEFVLDISNGYIAVDPGVTLTLRNMSLRLINDVRRPSNPLNLLSDSSCLVLQNVTVYLDGDWDFDKGSLEILGGVEFKGNYAFNYYSTQYLTINSDSWLIFDIGSTFKFDPKGTGAHGYDYRFLVSMTDASSVLYFNGSTFNVPAHGIELFNGTLVFDNRVYINNLDRNGNYNEYAESGISLGSEMANPMQVYVLSGARVELAGYLDLGEAVG